MVRSQNKWELDVQGFLNTCAITAALPRQQIRDFAQGINQLGLWNSMVCWPLRSSQNAATGNTMFSLGGLGAFDGTMVNNPTRGADGMEFDGSNDHITLPNESFGTGSIFQSVWTFLKNDTTGGLMVPWAAGDHNISAQAFNVQSPATSGGNDQSGAAFTSLSLGATSAVWKSLLSGHDASLLYGGRNGGSVTSTTLLNAINKNGQNCGIGFLRTPPLYYFDGLIAAVIRINATPTTTLNSQIYTLYKSTLGSGLALP